MNNQSQIQTNSAQDNTQLIEDLQKAFEKHREQYPAKPYPSQLREAIVDALSRGIKYKALQIACKISADQIYHWKRDWKRDLKRNNIPETKVLQVVDSVIPKQISTRSDKIELRIGDWHITLQQNCVNDSL